MICSAYDDIRKLHLPYDFQIRKDTADFNQLMGTQNPVHLNQLGTYVFRAFKQRKEKLEAKQKTI